MCCGGGPKSYLEDDFLLVPLLSGVVSAPASQGETAGLCAEGGDGISAASQLGLGVWDSRRGEGRR